MNQHVPFLTVFLLSFLLLGIASLSAQNADRKRETDNPSPRELPALQSNYPRAYFFRSSSGFASNTGRGYSWWENTFSQLMGIEGKLLQEELLGRERSLPWFRKFKRNNPEQLVLLHYNGNARDPRYQRDAFYAGHWLYFNGATITEDVPAESGTTKIHVSNPDLFRTDMGRYGSSNEDIGLCVLDENGEPDWSRSEQVKLIEIDAGNNVIKVERGQYGTDPISFEANASYAAAHVTEGPWGKGNNIMWYYNYSTRCPIGPNGRRALEVHAQDVADRFKPGAPLASLDGLEFDVLLHRRAGGKGVPERGMDTNADGNADNGTINGVNRYGIGVWRFLKLLRWKMGDDKLILADGMSGRHQRAIGVLNGIESEGFPVHRDHGISDWSGGLNRHMYWDKRARPPVFNYINHKFIHTKNLDGDGPRGIPWRVHRLVFAAGVFTNSAICYSLSPPAEPGERYGIWDELVQGQAQNTGWLGKPLGPAKHLSRNAPDLLNGKGTPISPNLAERFSGRNVQFEQTKNGLRGTSTSQGSSLQARLRNLPTDGSDLYVEVTARSAPRSEYPFEMPRLMHVGVSSGIPLSTSNPRPRTGMKRRGEPIRDIDPGSGAHVSFNRKISIDGKTFSGFKVHPPYKNPRKPGMTFWERSVRIPGNARLLLYTGMGSKSPERSDGVVFRVDVMPQKSAKSASNTILKHKQKANKWIRHEVDLDRWSGQEVRLRFVADVGPANDSTTDHARWGGVRVGPADQMSSPTPTKQYMSWTDRDPFQSSFYFEDIRSDHVNLTFSFEGNEPVEIQSLTAHAAPDVMYRKFENGLVLANPAPRPVTLDLSRIWPDEQFRHLNGSSRQDPDRNDGSPVGGTVTLKRNEGLFLIRSK